MASRGVTWQNRCINCSLSIPRNQKTHALEQVSTPMFNMLQSWITPTQLASNSVLCTECLTLLQGRANTTSEGSLSLPAFGHRRVCLSCGKSILHATRTYPVKQDRHERKFIIRLVPLHLVSRLERVCAACWRSATREVRRHHEQDYNRPGLSTVAKLTTGTEDDENETNTKHIPKQCVAASEFTLPNGEYFIKQEIIEEISDKNAEDGEIAASEITIPSVFMEQEKEESSIKEEKDDEKVSSELAIPSVFIKQEIIEECSIKKEKDDEIVTSELIIPTA